jgi:hypothetical protein
LDGHGLTGHGLGDRAGFGGGVFDQGTSRAVAAALGALQRRQRELTAELAAQRGVVAQLEQSLASRTEASRKEDAALHEAELNERSRGAVQVQERHWQSDAMGRKGREKVHTLPRSEEWNAWDPQPL